MRNGFDLCQVRESPLPFEHVLRFFLFHKTSIFHLPTAVAVRTAVTERPVRMIANFTRGRKPPPTAAVVVRIIACIVSHEEPMRMPLISSWGRAALPCTMAPILVLVTPSQSSNSSCSGSNGTYAVRERNPENTRSCDRWGTTAARVVYVECESTDHEIVRTGTNYPVLSMFNSNHSPPRARLYVRTYELLCLNMYEYSTGHLQ